MVQWQQEEKPLLVIAEPGCAAGKNGRKQGIYGFVLKSM